MFLEQSINPDKKSTSDITDVLKHLSLKLKLYKSDTDKQIDKLANIVAVDYRQPKIKSYIGRETRFKTKCCKRRN